MLVTILSISHQFHVSHKMIPYIGNCMPQYTQFINNNCPYDDSYKCMLSDFGRGDYDKSRTISTTITFPWWICSIKLTYMARKDSANKTNSSNNKILFLPSCQCQDFFNYIIKEKVTPESRRKTHFIRYKFASRKLSPYSWK